MKIHRRPTPAPHIPFISLADIAWQIIIFFLVASTFVSHYSLNVPMPSGSAANTAGVTRSIKVRAGENRLSVNGVNVSVEELEAYLATMLAGLADERDRAVIVFPEDDLPFQKNADVLYAIQKAGGIAVISQEKPDANAP